DESGVSPRDMTPPKSSCTSTLGQRNLIGTTTRGPPPHRQSHRVGSAGMEISEDEYQELAELDRIRSSNPVLDALLQGGWREFPAWAQQHGGDWDFTPDSLERLETVVRSRYTSSDQAWEDRGSDFLQTAAWYVGEVHNRTCGTQWQYHPDFITVDPVMCP